MTAIDFTELVDQQIERPSSVQEPEFETATVGD
jgi:hypothetical protein